MSRTESKMLALGTAAPNFSLLDTLSGNTLDLETMTGTKGTVIMLICNHCPFVIHVNPEISKMAKEYRTKGFGFIAISSNDIINYPQDSPELMKLKAKEEDYTFPYLYDETQEIAKAYNASCTPDFYLFDDRLKLVYRGQLDNSRPGNGAALTGEVLRKAMDGILAESPVIKHQKPSIGCNIKWKSN
jgi:thiol-disulfide isomerase/thioredoxin